MNHLPRYFSQQGIALLAFYFMTFLGLSFKSAAQQKGMSSQFERLDAFYKEQPTEKIYIHTNREVLSLGDTVWMSVYAVAGPYHAVSKISGLAYVELIDPNRKVMSTLHVRLDSLGVGAGQFALPDSLLAGVYYLRAYTNYMRNFPETYFFTKTLHIQPRISKQEIKENPEATLATGIQIYFFPEGGNLISGLPNKMAFKCIDEKQKPVEITGIISDENDNAISSFTTTHDGMGLMLFTPDHKKNYQAKFYVEGKEFTTVLPQVLPSGYLMSIRQSRDNIYLTVAASIDQDLNNTLLLAHSKGKFFYEAQPAGNGKLLYITLKKDTIPSGILHFTFFDSNGLPICERLAFNDMIPDVIPIQLNFPDNIKKREGVDLSIAVPENFTGNLSMSIVPSNLFSENQASILEYLMLTSDLKGYVHNPMHYLNKQNPNRVRDLDLLMMTHGWRRFEWTSLLADDQKLLKYFPESGFSVSGQVTGYLTRNKGKKLPLELSFIENVLVIANLETSETGDFVFTNLPVEDTMTVVVRAMNEKKGEVEKSALITINAPETIKDLNYLPPVTMIDPEKTKAAKEKGKELFDIMAAFDKDVIILDEFSISAQRDRFDDPYHRPYQLYSEPSGRLMMDSVPGITAFNNIFDVIRGRLSGVQVTGSYPNQSIMIRGIGSMRDNSVQFIFNGLPVTSDFINNINVRDISHIDVLTGADALVYPLSASGVVLIYTKDGFSTPLNRAQEGIAFQKIIGFHAPRAFYMPNYENPSDEEKIKPDFRSTLYWNPNIRPDSGLAPVRFFTSDETGAFVYVIEGLSSTGGIVRNSGEFYVK